MAASRQRGTGWLAAHWVTGAGFMAGGFLAIAPLLDRLLPVGLFLIFLHTPGYMIHQVEEHAGDRFRRFVNDRVFGGRDALGVVDVLVINLPLVWGLNLAALYAGVAWGAGWGLVAPYAMLVNAAAHFGASARFRAYNPGVVTAALLFVPLGVATIAVVGAVPGVSAVHHLAGLLLALLLHGAIIVRALRRDAALR